MERHASANRRLGAHSKVTQTFWGRPYKYSKTTSRPELQMDQDEGIINFLLLYLVI